MKIQPLMALVVLSLATVPGARAAVRGFKARTLGLLTLACLLVAAPATAQVNYAVSGSTAYVASSPNASGDIVIASTYFGDTVTWIGNCAFCSCTNLRSVTIPYGVTRLGSPSPVFSGCTSLTNISVDPANSTFSSLDGVVFNKVGFRAFAGCTRLTNVTIGNGVTNIGSGAFSGCTNLASVTIPNSVTIIPDRAFENCTSLTSVTIPNGVISIGGGAFYRCTSLTSVTIPDSVTQIGTTLYAGGGGSAFAYCTSLTNVIIGNSVINIGSGAFSACTNLTRLTIPASVINLGFAAFYGCTSLTNFTFLGNAPGLAFDMDGGFAQFDSVGAGAKVYYYCGTTGWGTGYGGLPTVMLCPPQIRPGSAGVKPGGFGFTLTRLTNQTIVVEASTNLPNWQPIWTNTPPDASVEFVDPEWLNHSNRFYRAR